MFSYTSADKSGLLGLKTSIATIAKMHEEYWVEIKTARMLARPWRVPVNVFPVGGMAHKIVAWLRDFLMTEDRPKKKQLFIIGPPDVDKSRFVLWLFQEKILDGLVYTPHKEKENFLENYIKSVAVICDEFDPAHFNGPMLKLFIEGRLVTVKTKYLVPKDLVCEGNFKIIITLFLK